MFAALLAAIAFLVSPIPPCELEDGSGQTVCRWDAGESGNGVGSSFVTVNVAGASLVIYDDGEVILYR